MLAHDLALLTDAARAAGSIALHHFGRGPRTWDKGGGLGPVTEADLQVDAMLRARLLGARPDYGWLSEESDPAPGRLSAPAMFVVDPIDGTRAFIDGQHGFAHALAVVRAGRAMAAVVHLPMLGLTYTAARGAGAWLNGARLRASVRARLDGATVLATRAALAPAHWPGGVPAVTRHFRTSLAWRLALVGEGAFDAMLSLRDTWHWDIAAASLIAEEAGTTVSDRTGRPLAFDTLDPRSPGVVAAGAGIHAALMARLGTDCAA